MSYINLCDKCAFIKECTVGRHTSKPSIAYRIANMPFFGPAQKDHPTVVEIVSECTKFA